MELAAIPVGLTIGLAIGMVGGGGSMLAVPVLVYAFGQAVPVATTESLVVVTAGALSGGLVHARGGRVCWRHAAAFSLAALPALAVGTVAGNHVSGKALIAAFAVVMLAAAAATWKGVSLRRGEARASTAEGCPPLRLARDLAAGSVIGLMTGFFGVGGGFLIVPALALGLTLSMRLAIGTSLAIITAISVSAVAVHVAAGRTPDIGLTATMAFACVIGAVAGSASAGRVPQRQLAHGFTGLIVAVALYLLVSAAFLGGPPTA